MDHEVDGVKSGLRKTNMKRLASLSALGAGALGVSAGNAAASSIVYSGILNEPVGFNATTFSRGFFGPNGAGGVFKLIYCVITCGPSFGNTTSAVALVGKSGAHGTHFRFAGTRDNFFALGFPANALWGTAFQGASTQSADLIAQNIFAKVTEFNDQNRYLLFRFTGGSLPEDLYGWAQLEVQFGQFGAPSVTLVDWAYDTSGAQIPAGDTGTPEPSTFVLTGLAAVALGAKGLRAWRGAKKV